MKLTDPDERRRKPVPEENAEFEIKADLNLWDFEDFSFISRAKTKSFTMGHYKADFDTMKLSGYLTGDIVRGLH